MGHTHYYRNKRAFTDAEWKAFTQDVKNLIAGCGVPIGNGQGDIGSAPSFNKSSIMFNGVGDDSHETAYVPKGSTSFEFCKTNRKPYDKVVVALYKLIRKYDPNVILSSDSGPKVFGDSKSRLIKVNDKWTYDAGDFNVAVGDTVILPPTPYTDGKNWEGTVTAIGSTYCGGYIKTIVGVKVVTLQEKIAHYIETGLVPVTLQEKIAHYLATDFHLNDKAAKKGAVGVLNIVNEHLSS